MRKFRVRLVHLQHTTDAHRVAIARRRSALFPVFARVFSALGMFCRSELRQDTFARSICKIGGLDFVFGVRLHFPNIDFFNRIPLLFRADTGRAEKERNILFHLYLII